MASLLLISFLPSFASYESPTKGEQNAFNQLLSEFQKIKIPKKDVSDVISTFNKPLITTFTCNANDTNHLIVIVVKTALAKFDKSTTHQDMITGGTYTWQCLITTEQGTITVYCNNELRLNPDVISNYTGIDYGIHQIENLAILYHEFLHGQLMIDAIKNSSQWREEICNKQPGDTVDYSYADSDHKVINPLQTQFTSELVAKSGGKMLTQEITPQETTDGKFSTQVLNLRDYPEFENGAKITMRASNMENTSFSTIQNNVFLDGQLVNKTKSGMVWFYIFKDQNQTTSSYEPIPMWAKRAAGLWSNQGNDTAIYPVIQYLVDHNLLTLNNDKKFVTKIPDWIKKDASWWYAGIIDDHTFLASFQYLISVGVIS
ncbi:MAG: hypothetical protein ABI340_04700 [Nitrososphaera sp.]